MLRKLAFQKDLFSSHESSKSVSSKEAVRRVALVGNPNCGKSTLFNALTGLRQKVGNYPGVTVEKKVGRCFGSHGEILEVLDLPGTYSLQVRSPDEAITRDVLLGRRSDTPTPDVIICVVDASNLERTLSTTYWKVFLGLLFLDIGKPRYFPISAKIFIPDKTSIFLLTSDLTLSEKKIEDLVLLILSPDISQNFSKQDNMQAVCSSEASPKRSMSSANIKWDTMVLRLIP